MVAAISSPVADVLAAWRGQAAYQAAGAATLELVLACAALLIRRHLRSRDLLSKAQAANAESEGRLAIAQERARADHELGMQNVRFVTALDSMTQALCLFDAAGGLVMANRRLVEIYGLDPAAVTAGMTVDMLLDQATIKSNMQQSDIDSMRGSVAQMQAARIAVSRTRHMEDGRTLAINFVMVKGDGYLMTMEDVTDRKAAAAQIAHMAHHDALTGLPNRVRFLDKLGEAIAHSRRGGSHAVLYLDLDHFKAVNDTLGHPIGDGLLRQVAQRLRDQIRDTETVARLGGDEFALVLAIEQPSDASGLADRLIHAICQPYDIEGHKVTIGTSVGIALVPDDGEDADTLMKNADMALYSAKADGRGRCHFFEPRMDAQMRERRLLELDLRHALVEGEFQVYYQPLMNLKTEMVTGFEALLRWHHPERGLVSPAQFIPLAEEIGVIVPLGNWVLRQACADAAGWPGALKVAVNVSVVQFGSHTLVEDVAAALEASGLPASRLELEITETVMLADTDAILVILHQLRDLGVGIAMDDFGTGYSSLSYLRRFPFSKVKIDRSFIEGLGSGGECDAIVTAVTDLCETLGMTTLAEGVETEVQLAQLRAGNCGEAQGYLFSPPRPASEVAAMCLRLTHMPRVEGRA
jgi:diguanylate cyclase (GGDEF)-like protein/PAS domain S-box-containing protein